MTTSHNQSPRTVVVGAGLAGLSAAVRLVDAGHHVTVLERASVVGGRTANWDDEGMTVETGLHRYLGFYVELLRLLDHIGQDLGDVVVWEDEVGFRVPDGGPQAVYATSLLHKPLASVARALGNNDYVPMRQKLALARMLAAGIKDYVRRPAKLDRISVADYAHRHGLNDDTIFKILVPLTEGLFFVPPQEYSAHNFMGIIVPYWNSVVKTRLGGFTGGMTDVMTGPIAEYVRDKGADIRLSTTVTGLVTDDDAVVGVRTEAGTVDADAVVLAASLGPAQALIREAFPGHRWFADMLSLESTPSVCFQIELEQPCMEVDRATFAPGKMLASFSEQSRTTFTHTNGRLSAILAQPDEFLGKSADELLPLVAADAARVGIDLEGHVRRYRKVEIPEDFYSLRVNNEHPRPDQRTQIQQRRRSGDDLGVSHLFLGAARHRRSNGVGPGGEEDLDLLDRILGAIVTDVVVTQCGEIASQPPCFRRAEQPVDVVSILVIQPRGGADPFGNFVRFGNQQRSGPGDLDSAYTIVRRVKCWNCHVGAVDYRGFEPAGSSGGAPCVRRNARRACLPTPGPGERLGHHEVHGNALDRQPRTGLALGVLIEACLHHCRFNEWMVPEEARV